MSARNGICTGLGECNLAGSRTLQQVASSEPFVCRECGRALQQAPAAPPRIASARVSPGGAARVGSRPVPGSRPFPEEARRTKGHLRFAVGVGFGVVLFLAFGGLSYSFAHEPAPPRPLTTSAPPPTTAPTPPAGAAQDVLRLAGSSTISAQLAPALAAAYLLSRGGTPVPPPATGPDEVRVQGAKDGTVQRITISGRGSQAAFDGLAEGAIDIGLASRRVRPDEVQRLAPLGTMTSPANEHVLALDGVAVIVSRANPVSELTREQLAGILDGTTADWSGARGQPGPIHVYGREAGSGTQSLVQMLVLGKAPLVRTATRLLTNQAVLYSVGGDPASIGVVALPWARGAKVVAVSEGGGAPMIPNAFTLATEDYFLARRLFLYTPQASKNPHVSRFVEFALGPEGQAVVKKTGFVELTVRAEPRGAPEGAPAEYVRVTTGARRLSTNFGAMVIAFR